MVYDFLKDIVIETIPLVITAIVIGLILFVPTLYYRNRPRTGRRRGPDDGSGTHVPSDDGD